MATKKSMPKKTKKSIKKNTKTVKNKHPMEQRFEHFGKEMEGIGKKIEKKFDDKSCSCENWFDDTFGLVGPLISSIIGIVFMGIGVWVLRFLNSFLDISFLTGIALFIETNMGLFFIMFMVFSFNSYLYKRHPRAYSPISPLVVASGVAIVFWLCTGMMEIANLSLGIEVIDNVIDFIRSSMTWFFIGFIILGYLVILGERKCPLCTKEKTSKSFSKSFSFTSKKANGKIKRLYRSGEEKILGGVCGGIGEYLNVDPVIIRLIWIVGTISLWGTGVIAYIIAWIIIPRNPKHEWKDD